MALYFYVGKKYPVLQSLVNKYELVVFDIIESQGSKYFEYNPIVYYDERKRREVVKQKSVEHVYRIHAYPTNQTDLSKIKINILSIFKDISIPTFTLKIKKMAFVDNFMEFNEVNAKKYIRLLKLKNIEI